MLNALLAPASEAQEVRSVTPAPPRAEGEGPWKRLILRGATLVDGTGAPPVGPVDIVVMGNRIQSIRSVGAPGVPIDESKRPKAETGDHEIALQGHYVLPGFVDLHGHLGGSEQGTPAEYVLKLWMAHGITTSADERIELERALETLPATARAVVWLHDVEGLTHREIGKLMGRTASFSKSQLARAHERLKGLLGSAAEQAEPEGEGVPCDSLLKTC